MGESVPRLGLRPLWSDPDSLAHAQLAAYETAGRTDLADALRPLAQAPTATWFTGDAPRERARALTTAAAAAGELPVLVAYDVPGRDCGSFSAGGAADDDAYLAWIRELAAGIGDRPAVVVLEPDAVAFAVTGCSGVDRRDRLGLLRRAVEVLAALPAPTSTSTRGTRAGCRTCRRWRRRCGRRDRPGRGLRAQRLELPAHGRHGRLRPQAVPPPGRGALRRRHEPERGGRAGRHGPRRGLVQPAGRRIGRLPSTLTGEDVVDAWLWVKRPGESDGSCRPGEPAAGEWFEGYALALVGV